MVDLLALQRDLEEFVPHVIAHGSTPGFSVALGVADDVWLGTWGYSDLASMRPMGPEAVVRTGSMGKIYTATAVMHLVDAGVVNLDEPISRYLAFPVVNPLGESEITVRHLLRHRSGLTSNFAYASASRPRPLADHLAHVLAENRHDTYGGGLLPMWSSKVGEQFQYTNTGIALAGLVVEQANDEGLSFGEYTRKHVFEPLGMFSTIFEEEPLETIRPDLAAKLTTGYMALAGSHTPTPRLWIGDVPAGSSVTMPTDHIRLLQAHFSQKVNSVPQILTDATRDLALTAVEFPGSPSDRGLVWQVWDPGTPHWSFGHGGAHMWGWTNSSRAWPEHGVALVTCANQWELAEGQHRPRYAEADLCNDFVTAWLRTDGDVLSSSRRHSWDWKVSYVIGMTMAERLGPRLGVDAEAITAPLTELVACSTLSSMATWDAAGFDAGVRDVVANTHREPMELVEYLTQGGDGLSPEEARLIWRQLGGRTGRPIVGFP